MKKIISLLLTMTLVFALVFSFAVVAHADDGVATTQQSDFVAALIDNAAEIVKTLILAGIGALGVWVSKKLEKSTYFGTVRSAWDECVKAAQITVGELKQTVVDDMKAANKDGKLTKDEVAKLREDLFENAKRKMSQPAYDILMAAGVDVNALILGAGDAFIEKMKRDPQAILLDTSETLKE